MAAFLLGAAMLAASVGHPAGAAEAVTQQQAMLVQTESAPAEPAQVVPKNATKPKRAHRHAAKKPTKAAPRSVAMQGDPDPLMPPLTAEEAQDALDQDLSLKVGKQMRADDYPEDAVRLRWTGTALIEVLVGRDGKVHEVTLAQTSGYQILDDQALAVVKRVTRLFVPQQLRNRELKASVPVSFSLQGL